MAAYLRSWLPAPARTGLATQKPQPANRRKTGFPRILFPCSANFEALSSAHERSIRRQLPVRRRTLRGHRTTGIGSVVPLRKLQEA